MDDREVATRHEPDSTTMTLVEHLSELRSRLIRSLLAVVVMSGVGFVAAPTIRRLLVSPVPTHQVQALAPGDAFGITVRIALIVGVVLAMPVILYQAWAFVGPALTNTEKRGVTPWFAAAAALFVIGLWVGWLLLPYAIQFLLGFTDDVILGDRFAAGPYFDFVTGMLLGIAISMEFPVLLVGLARVGVVSSDILRRGRRYAVVCIGLFAAVITPGGDVTAPIVLGLLMFGLCEATVYIIRRAGR